MYTALIVDDDPLVLEVVAQILREPGFNVVTARDGYEAIRILADRHIDLMITDIMMPGLDGVQLGVQAKLMRPRLHIIYVTAFIDAAKGAQYGKVIEKPVRAAHLVEIIQRTMTSS
ncbi:MAG TPA: response regulator [Stellaceae bacterium]|nr:response regulator [Stellaceae bacterium]